MQGTEKGHEMRDVDVTAAGRGVWLVKVPKYLSERWEDSETSEVGVMRITRSKQTGQKPSFIFTSTDTIMSSASSRDKSGGATAIPKQHKFAITGVGNQNLTVFSQSGDRIAIEGKVMQRAECLPIADDNYMKLKRSQLEINNKPKREIVLLQNVVMAYKPRSDHISNMEEKRHKKEQEKRSRVDKDRVMDMLFAAFEKHQYYNVKDLVGITKQPIPYLKEILQEICVYNMKAPHKNMWELKPEYRHYKQQDSGT